MTAPVKRTIYRTIHEELTAVLTGRLFPVVKIEHSPNTLAIEICSRTWRMGRTNIPDPKLATIVAGLSTTSGIAVGKRFYQIL